MRRAALTLTCVMTATLIQGCDVGTSDSQGETGSGSCEARTYDLTRPPTRSDFDMADGEATVDVSCDSGFEVTLRLPDDATTTITARRLNADSYAATDSATGDPTTLDLHSVALDPDTAVQVTHGVADDLTIDAQQVTRWRHDVAAAPESNVDSPFMRSTLGYLTAELQVQYLAASGNSYVHLVLSWG